MHKYKLQEFQIQRVTTELVTPEETLILTKATSLPGTGLLISSVLRQTEALSNEAARKFNLCV
jgi:hypothetical protein